MIAGLLAHVLFAAIAAFDHASPAGSEGSRDAAAAKALAMTPAHVLEMLEQGNRRFASGGSRPRNLVAKVKGTAARQTPHSAVVSCMDSRVPPEIVFDQAIGDLFVLRVAGNVMSPDFLGSLEFATKVAGARLILVLGHTRCGAVQGAIDHVKLGNLTGLLSKLQPAIEAAGPGESKDPAYVRNVSERNVRLTMKRVRDESAVLREMVETGEVLLAGGMYDLDTGKVAFLRD